MTNTTNKISMVLALGLGFTAAGLASCSQAQGKHPSRETVSHAQSSIQFTHVNAAQAHALLDANPNVVVLDIRTAEEIATGHIKGAIFADFYGADFADQVAKLDRKTPMLIHCRSGGRSTKALETLKALGFQDVSHLDGGIIAWKKAGYPVETP